MHQRNKELLSDLFCFAFFSFVRVQFVVVRFVDVFLAGGGKQHFFDKIYSSTSCPLLKFLGGVL